MNLDSRHTSLARWTRWIRDHRRLVIVGWLAAFTRVIRADYRARGVSGSTLILGPVGEAGVGARTAEELGLKLPPVGLVSPAKIGKLTVKAIRGDKAELAVLPGPGKALRALMDRFPGLGPAMNRTTGTNKTMATVSDYREWEARLAAAERDAADAATAERSARARSTR